MPGFLEGPEIFDGLLWIVLGALVGWLAFWVIDKVFRRDGEPADVDTVKALEGIDTLEAQLKETADERDSLRTEAEAQRNEAQRLGGLLAGLREAHAEQEQRITSLQAALDAAREPQRGELDGAAPPLLGAAAAAAMSVANADVRPAGKAPPSAADTDADADDFEWTPEEDSAFDTLDELSDQFPDLEDQTALARLENDFDKTLPHRPLPVVGARAVMGRLDGDAPVDDPQRAEGLLGRLGRERPDSQGR